MTVGADFYLCRQVQVTVTTQSVDLGDVPVMTYDLTGDGYVNARDLVTLQQYAADIDRGDGAYERLLDFNRRRANYRCGYGRRCRFYRCRKLDESIYD